MAVSIRARPARAKATPVSTDPPHRPAKAMAVSTPRAHEQAKAMAVSIGARPARAKATLVSRERFPMPVGGGGAWPSFETTHQVDDQRPGPTGVEGAGGTGGHGRASRRGAERSEVA